MKVVICLASVILLVGLSHQQSKKDCNLEPETGSCRGSLRRFYFHPSCEECDTFTYGGCGGNANNFKSIEECEKTCFPVCKLKPVTGRCRAAFRRYFYDPDSERCKKFIYGGCGGNANNFKTKAACEKECVPVCELKPKVGRCKARKRRFFYNSDSQKCEEFFYGGCDGNANNFKSVAECEETCIPVCNLKPEVGRCRAAIPRFFYDPDTDTCKEFTYGGCGGNGNNFKTKAECEDTCF
ncbi:carboxypeptidase inhibitor SmCI-like isoform X2 [Haliotis rubra]|uniref:carboxypeptidase inhibitor SmCI-like isoform X2 n=2 Tax=Haliotis rubra TaxID=36100 RepID=UPI001EE5AE0A|nr:carboxypeptidase inhibitor SmCI-like isoform X2 [Haliotis rubra]